VVATSLYAVSTANVPTQTQASSSLAVVAGTQLLVACHPIRNGHTNGLDAAWALPTTTATLNTITWTEVAISALNTAIAGATFEEQSIAWLSSALTDDESIVITCDAHSGGTSDFYYAMQVLELPGGLWSVVNDASGTSGSGSSTATFSPAPEAGNLQLLLAYGVSGGGGIEHTWGSPPAGFTALAGAESPNVGETEVHTAESVTNSTAGLTWAWTPSAGSALGSTILAIELFTPPPLPELTGFRYYNDDGAETATTPAAAENVALSAGPGVRYLLRVQLALAAGAPDDTTGKTVRYKRTDEPESEWRTL
jgi:hypothetical protein